MRVLIQIILSTLLIIAFGPTGACTEFSDDIWEMMSYEHEPLYLRHFLRTNAQRIHLNLEQGANPCTKPLKALVLFDIDKKGNVSNARAMRMCRGLGAVVTLPENEFESIEKMLTKALYKSSPLTGANEADEFMLIYDPSQPADLQVYLDKLIASNLPEIIYQYDCDSPWVEPSKALTYVRQASGNRLPKLAFPKRGSYYKWREAFCYYQVGRRFLRSDIQTARKNLERAVATYPYDHVFIDELTKARNKTPPAVNSRRIPENYQLEDQRRNHSMTAGDSKQDRATKGAPEK
jgi:hypothetical protein